jgi:hypothetical protein
VVQPHHATDAAGVEAQPRVQASRGPGPYYGAIAGLTTDSLSDTTKPRYVKVLLCGTPRRSTR